MIMSNDCSSTGKNHIVIMAGTRPEVIKMVPVIKKLEDTPAIHVTVCATGQHREILNGAFEDFRIVPDVNLDVMTGAQSLGHLSSVLFEKFDRFLTEARPDWLLVQGDTTSVMIAALCAFYHHVRVGHVEAGLRSHDMLAPFPEELNRRVTTLVVDVHFAPTDKSRQNLLAEGVADSKIIVTGNTVADALLLKLADIRKSRPAMPRELQRALTDNKRIVLLTAHRRENHGEKLKNIFTAIRKVSRERNDVCFVYPVHPNPAVREPAQRFFHDIDNVVLCEPFSYAVLLTVMEKAAFVVTDSGGIQEEGCILRKPVLVLRETTEREEGVEAGAAKLLGSDGSAIATWLHKLLDDANLCARMASAAGDLYGDGHAAERIAQYFTAATPQTER